MDHSLDSSKLLQQVKASPSHGPGLIGAPSEASLRHHPVGLPDTHRPYHTHSARLQRTPRDCCPLLHLRRLQVPPSALTREP